MEVGDEGSLAARNSTLTAGREPDVETMRPVSESLIIGLVRGWSAKKGRRAEEAGHFLEQIAEAMLTPRERAQRVDAELVRRLG